MRDTRAISLTNGRGRSVMMLCALRIANAANTFPTITELSRAYDERPIIPRPTLASRRRMVHAMIGKGLIGVNHIDDANRSRYELTPEGFLALLRVMSGGTL